MSTIKLMPSGNEPFSADEYYESRSVGTRAHSDKTCVYCGGTIPKGQPHDMHHFYPEFNDYPTHTMDPEHGDNLASGTKSCSELFLEALV